ncbi:tRNA maturation protein LHP1 NDAI_0D04490 [Naumovozyma dairenensis CBS 421]|uniref:HTH La-type RNA-binding domain-containing protein n=1 Tax=Naumovozyma dairenensis (strain ATCC 10597 / BCRC 20456 / CBS 421 / NBRC 0211 / NRRL Y-12639) TaxID=1071378 RepID=G0WAF2_NAUDC|nr:hypothetical protein NDAI_0D04490 [Naumovozyma dairenensis CBS 421]CCD24763.1 hypothetical protein NDAI_0D04490 [Naumovozyma dairenensis CBS 421]
MSESADVTPQPRRNSFSPIEFNAKISQQCLKQVEFYFSESNFPYDKFLRSTAEKNDGWVPISTIATFNRMKKYRPVDKVIEILKTSKILQVSEDGENVKRIVPLDLSKDSKNSKRFDQNKRTLVIMNFPHENVDVEFIELQENIENFLHDLANVNQVRLRKDHQKKFNGNVIVEFQTLNDCEDFKKKYSVDNKENPDQKEPLETLSYENRKLNVLTKKQFDLQREATKSKNFSGSGQRSRSFTGHRKNMPKITPPESTEKENETAEKASESAIEADKEN